MDMKALKKKKKKKKKWECILGIFYNKINDGKLSKDSQSNTRDYMWYYQLLCEVVSRWEDSSFTKGWRLYHEGVTLHRGWIRKIFLLCTRNVPITCNPFLFWDLIKILRSFHWTVLWGCHLVICMSWFVHGNVSLPLPRDLNRPNLSWLRHHVIIREK